MLNLRKNKNVLPAEKQLAELKEDLKECRKQMKRAESMFGFATDENLIEARIYEMKSLAKHHDYITASIRQLIICEKENIKENQSVNV